MSDAPRGCLDGKVAIVTGAGRGIGRGITLALAKEGAAVVIVDRDAGSASSTAAELRQLGARSVAVVGDIASEADVRRAVASTVDAFGRIDILVNNAQGVSVGMPFEAHADADLELALSTGLWGTFRFMRACFPHLKERGGKIVNVGSSAGTHGFAGFAGYAAAKEGIRGLTKVAANEWGKHGINVNLICPQSATPASLAYFADRPEELRMRLSKRPIARDGDPEHDIGRTVLYLVGPDSDFVTGMTLMVNGGSSIMP
jgi:NAD(P)-dependent dehydrogenase (short-subunit alcohol dehydrogenase family)